MTTYTVSLNVSSAMLPTLLQVIERTRGITMTSLSLVSSNGETPSLPPTRYRDGKRNKGIPAHELILTSLQQSAKPLTLTQLTEIFTSRGFAESSMSAAASKLAAKGKILRQTRDGIRYFSLKPPTSK